MLATATEVKLDLFTGSFLESLIWDILDIDLTMENIAPDVLDRLVEECQRFQEEIGDLVGYRWNTATPHEILAGSDFYYSRQDPTRGFGDGDWRGGEKMVEIAQRYGSLKVTVDEDRIIRVEFGD